MRRLCDTCIHDGLCDGPLYGCRYASVDNTPEVEIGGGERLMEECWRQAMGEIAEDYWRQEMENKTITWRTE